MVTTPAGQRTPALFLDVQVFTDLAADATLIDQWVRDIADPAWVCCLEVLLIDRHGASAGVVKRTVERQDRRHLARRPRGQRPSLPVLNKLGDAVEDQATGRGFHNEVLGDGD
jgi:hypothetical protein